eukprot:5346851-Amphidinium_carterae.1
MGDQGNKNVLLAVNKLLLQGKLLKLLHIALCSTSGTSFNVFTTWVHGLQDMVDECLLGIGIASDSVEPWTSNDV